MLKTYIFDDANKKWIEEDKSLLLHDLCAILDEERNIIYLWNGPKSSQEKLKRGYSLLETLMSYYPTINFNLLIIKKKIPDEVQEKIDIMLNEIKQEHKIENYKFSRFTTLRFFFIFLLASIILPLISYANLTSSLSWTQTDGNFEIGANAYNNWLLISNILVIISLILFSIMLIIGIIENERQAIVFSLLGALICTGLVIYLQQGIFLFLFQPGSTSSTYFFRQTDIIEFLIVILIGLLAFEIPNAIKLISLIKIYRKFIF